MKRRFDSLQRTPHTRCGTRAPGDGPEGIAPGDETLIQLMQREVARQARFALIAAGRVEHWLHYLPDDPAYAGVAHQEAEDQFWSSVQSFLVSAAMVSKLLWGVGDARQTSRRPLRERLDVGEGSMLRDRDLRNTFEHFDERLEAFFNDLPDHEPVDAYIGSFMGISLRDPRSLLRGFDPITFALTYQGRRYELRPIIAELRHLAEPDPRWTAEEF
jgi:hypothetical protein